METRSLPKYIYLPVTLNHNALRCLSDEELLIQSLLMKKPLEKYPMRALGYMIYILLVPDDEGVLQIRIVSIPDAHLSSDVDLYPLSIFKIKKILQ